MSFRSPRNKILKAIADSYNSLSGTSDISSFLVILIRNFAKEFSLDKKELFDSIHKEIEKILSQGT